MQNDIKTSSFTVMRKFNPENDFDFYDDNPIEMEKILKDLNRHRVQNKDPIEDTYINKNANKNADKNEDKNNDIDYNNDYKNDYNNDYNIDTFMDISTLTANFNLNMNIFDPYSMYKETYTNDNDNDYDHNYNDNYYDYNHNDNDIEYDDYIPSTQRWTNYFG
jgi:hypothetical protein